MLFVACGDDAAAPVAPAPPPPTAPPMPLPVAADSIDSAAQRALRGRDAAAVLRLLRSPQQAARALLQAAAGADIMSQGRAPQLLARLGDAAVGELAAALRDQSPVRRRIAALTCLQLGAAAKPLANALLAARDDSDAAVRTAAALAWRAVVDDQGELYRLHLAQDRALQDLQRR